MATTTQTAALPDLPETARIALDQSACIRSQSNIGETITHNICNGTTAVVPWGSADWLAAIFVGGLIAGIGLLLLALFAMIVRSVWEGY